MECTVVLSAYNGSRFLREQLDSIIHQTRKPDELILIDDCSTDNGETIKILNEYASLYEWIKVYQNSENMGWAASFMNAIDLASKEILFFSDQDDVWDLSKIDTMMRLMEEKKYNVLMSAVENVNENLDPLSAGRYTGQVEEDKFLFSASFLNPKGVGAAMCFQLDFLKRYKSLWNPEFGHDRFYQIMAVFFDTIHFVDLPLIKHRVHDKNATGQRVFSSHSRIKSINGNLTLIAELRNSSHWPEITADRKAIISDYIRFAELRKAALLGKSPFKFIDLLPYIKFYPSWKTWIGDLKCRYWGD